MHNFLLERGGKRMVEKAQMEKTKDHGPGSQRLQGPGGAPRCDGTSERDDSDKQDEGDGQPRRKIGHGKCQLRQKDGGVARKDASKGDVRMRNITDRRNGDEDAPGRLRKLYYFRPG